MPLCPFNMQDPCTASLGSRLNSASYYEVCSLREIPHSSRAELTSGVIQIIQTICVPVTSLMMVNSLRVENERLHFFFKLQAFHFVPGHRSLPGDSDSYESGCNVGDLGSIPA